MILFYFLFWWIIIMNFRFTNCFEKKLVAVVCANKSEERAYKSEVTSTSKNKKESLMTRK